MRIATRQLALWASILGLGLLSIQAKPMVDSNLLVTATQQYDLAKKIRFSNPDSALGLLDQAYQQLLVDGDTSKAVYALKTSANILGNLAQYKEAYDKLWQALSIADKANLRFIKAVLYIDIGRHFSFYKRRDKALEYFQVALGISKELVAEGKIAKSSLTFNYYAFCSTYRELDDFTLARKYLDSCFQHAAYGDAPIKDAFLTFELGSIQTAEKDYAEALQTFESIQPWFEANDPSYLVLFYTYMSDALSGLGRLDESEFYYKKALEISDEYKMHIDFSPIVHEKLSVLYLTRGDLSAAYQSLSRAKELDAKFFDSRSAANQSLLEIQDAFRHEQEAQQELLQKQKLERLEHQEDIWFLERIILMVSLLFMFTVGYLFFKYMRAKYQAEKQVLKKQKELELKKANEVLEIKNKELATSALKLIEKDENLALLKSKIKEANGKGNLDIRELNKVMRSISISNDRTWEEFEARFVAVNQDFYERLMKEYPKLSQRDLKLCALIKLNFSSKEMAKLLGISVESAHTSRYRLRKKMNLTRDVNLAEFIANY